VIHIDTIYETEAFRFLARGMKDRHAVSVVHAVMLYGENTMREFERWASEHLEEIDNEIAEQTKQYKIGDLTADLVFRRHDIKNVSDLQLVFDTFEKELIELTARLANEQHAHKQTRADWSRQQEHNKEAIARRDNRIAELDAELHDARCVAVIGDYHMDIKLGDVLRSLFDRVTRLKEEMGVMEKQLHATQNNDALTYVGYSSRVATVHKALFHDDPTDVNERRDRFAEEAFELLQACGAKRDDLVTLLDYVFSLKSGSVVHEIGDVETTLTSLCVELGVHRYDAAADGLRRLEDPETIKRIRAKRATRHGRGPLPGHNPNGYRAGESIPDIDAARKRFEAKTQPETIGHVMRSRDFSTGVPKTSGEVRDVFSAEPYDPEIPVTRSLLEAAVNELREWKVDRGGDDQVMRNLSAAIKHTPCASGDFTIQRPRGFRFGLGEPVEKIKGSKWRGHVVGFYRGSLTPEGYAVESKHEPGNVQVYPVAALERRYADD
jgi:hypothetical protein